MRVTQTVRCPNCGSLAQRHHLSGHQVADLNCPEKRAIQTECSVCDYLMVTCAVSGSVIEAHAPGIAIPKKPWSSSAETWNYVQGYQDVAVSSPSHRLNMKTLAR